MEFKLQVAIRSYLYKQVLPQGADGTHGGQVFLAVESCVWCLFTNHKSPVAAIIHQSAWKAALTTQAPIVQAIKGFTTT